MKKTLSIMLLILLVNCTTSTVTNNEEKPSIKSISKALEKLKF
jgi:hypothetical protein